MNNYILFYFLKRTLKLDVHIYLYFILIFKNLNLLEMFDKSFINIIT